MTVGDRWRLLIGERQILWGKNEFPSRLMTVFQEQDKYMDADWVQGVEESDSLPADQEVRPESQTPPDWGDDEDEDDGYEINERFGYRTTVGTVLARLRLMGFTPEASRRSMVEIRRSHLKDFGQQEDVLLVSPARGVRGTPHKMSCEEVIDAGIAAHIKACDQHGLDIRRLDMVEMNCLDELEFYFEDDTDDPRFLLAALLHGQDLQNTLTMDLSDLLAAEYCSSYEELSAQAVHELNLLTASTGPIIVITEGRFDAQVLPRALKIVRPEISGYFNFWDLETTKAAGGTDQVVKNMRSFAAAGVMNRVIGILDNDTAGRQAEKQLASAPLPEHYAVCRLPDVDYARHYPTLGPSGASTDDVTGRACSVEFHFGQGCLLGPDGKPVPVRWKTHIDPMNDYQGELANKPYVQERIKEMLREAEEGEKPLGREWDPMRCLAETLISLAEPEAE